MVALTTLFVLNLVAFLFGGILAIFVFIPSIAMALLLLKR